MYINQQKYHHENKEYSFLEIENKLKTICNLNKADSWIYPDLATKPVSTVAKVTRYIKSPLTYLANRFYIFRIAAYPLTSLVNRIYKWHGIDIEKSKLFLVEVKRCARSSFDPSMTALVDQAIDKFNLLFPKHQVSYQIHLPLLDTDKEFNLRLFENKLDDNAKYLGANQVLINDQCKIPRTLYHFLFIYFALKNGNDAKLYPLLKFSITMDDVERLKYLKLDSHKQTIDKLNSDILNLIKEKELMSDQLTWKDAKTLINEICKEFEIIFETVNTNTNPNYQDSDQLQNLYYHFYRFCFDLKNRGAHFKEITLKALELEWSMPLGTEILYRGATISKDDIFRDEHHSPSLSFASSLYSGLAFEGTPNGTCAYVYYNNLNDKQLYALSLTARKLEKFFFYPDLFKYHPLLPLVAKGEFSHPRLRVFKDKKTIHVNGAQGKTELVKKLAAFIPSVKIKNLSDYRNKIIALFQKNTYLLGSNTLRQWA